MAGSRNEGGNLILSNKHNGIRIVEIILGTFLMLLLVAEVRTYYYDPIGHERDPDTFANSIINLPPGLASENSIPFMTIIMPCLVVMVLQLIIIIVLAFKFVASLRENNAEVNNNQDADLHHQLVPEPGDNIPLIDMSETIEMDSETECTPLVEVREGERMDDPVAQQREDADTTVQIEETLAQGSSAEENKNINSAQMREYTCWSENENSPSATREKTCSMAATHSNNREHDPSREMKVDDPISGEESTDASTSDCRTNTSDDRAHAQLAKNIPISAEGRTDSPNSDCRANTSTSRKTIETSNTTSETPSSDRTEETSFSDQLEGTLSKNRQNAPSSSDVKVVVSQSDPLPVFSPKIPRAQLTKNIPTAAEGRKEDKYSDKMGDTSSFEKTDETSCKSREHSPVSSDRKGDISPSCTSRPLLTVSSPDTLAHLAENISISSVGKTDTPTSDEMEDSSASRNREESSSGSVKVDSSPSVRSRSHLPVFSPTKIPLAQVAKNIPISAEGRTNSPTSDDRANTPYSDKTEDTSSKSRKDSPVSVDGKVDISPSCKSRSPLPVFSPATLAHLAENISNPSVGRTNTPTSGERDYTSDFGNRKDSSSGDVKVNTSPSVRSKSHLPVFSPTKIPRAQLAKNIPISAEERTDAPTSDDRVGTPSSDKTENTSSKSRKDSPVSVMKLDISPSGTSRSRLPVYSPAKITRPQLAKNNPIFSVEMTDTPTSDEREDSSSSTDVKVDISPSGRSRSHLPLFSPTKIPRAKFAKDIPVSAEGWTDVSASEDRKDTSASKDSDMKLKISPSGRSISNLPLFSPSKIPRAHVVKNISFSVEGRMEVPTSEYIKGTSTPKDSDMKSKISPSDKSRFHLPLFSPTKMAPAQLAKNVSMTAKRVADDSASHKRVGDQSSIVRSVKRRKPPLPTRKVTETRPVISPSKILQGRPVTNKPFTGIPKSPPLADYVCSDGKIKLQIKSKEAEPEPEPEQASAEPEPEPEPEPEKASTELEKASTEPGQALADLGEASSKPE